jgi:hypothetical protein
VENMQPIMPAMRTCNPEWDASDVDQWSAHRRNFRCAPWCRGSALLEGKVMANAGNLLFMPPLGNRGRRMWPSRVEDSWSACRSVSLRGPSLAGPDLPSGHARGGPPVARARGADSQFCMQQFLPATEVTLVLEAVHSA